MQPRETSWGPEIAGWETLPRKQRALAEWLMLARLRNPSLDLAGLLRQLGLSEGAGRQAEAACQSRLEREASQDQQQSYTGEHLLLIAAGFLFSLLWFGIEWSVPHRGDRGLWPMLAAAALLHMSRLAFLCLKSRSSARRQPKSLGTR